MWKIAMPAVLGLGLLAGGTGVAHAQYYSVYPAGPTWQICPNTVYSYGYGSPHYYPYCGVESQSPGNFADPYRAWRPYTDNVGPKPSS